jgi:hypothetical protein
MKPTPCKQHTNIAAEVVEYSVDDGEDDDGNIYWEYAYYVQCPACLRRTDMYSIHWLKEDAIEDWEKVNQ